MNVDNQLLIQVQGVKTNLMNDLIVWKLKVLY